MSKKKADDMKNRIISIFHGLFAFFVSGYHIYRDNPQYDQQATPIQHMILLTSAAYFTYDFAACVYYGLSDMALVLHHTLCIMGILSCEMTNNGTTAIILLFLAEVSNFPMHSRVILRQLKMRYTKLYELADCLYLIAYIIARGVFMTRLAFTALPVAETPITPRVALFGIWAQSIYFINEMRSILKTKVKQYKERSQKGISLNWLNENERLHELSYFKNEGKDKVF